MSGETSSYYGRPIVKPHVWTPFIPWYFWIGGATGAATVHCAIERTRGNDALADVQKRVALAGVLISPVLLTLDLGVPTRFINMLRVFKPTSPMSVGSWLLTALGGIVFASNVADWAGARGVGRALEFPAALLGPCLTTYTAALIADTATPIWHEAHAELPFVFAASGISGAGALGAMFAPHEHAASARRMMVGGAIGMSVMAHRMEAQLGAFLAEPYTQGKAGSFKRMSGALGLAGAALGLVGGKSKAVTCVAATMVAAAGVFERFAVLAAGKQSAKDPKYTVEPQRARITLRQAQGDITEGHETIATIRAYGTDGHEPDGSGMRQRETDGSATRRREADGSGARGVRSATRGAGIGSDTTGDVNVTLSLARPEPVEGSKGDR